MPFLVIREELLKLFNFVDNTVYLRRPISSSKIYICVHEWGGYNSVRRKILKNGKSFECGLDAQTKRFAGYSGEHSTDLTITLSDGHLYGNKEYLRSKCDRLIEVSNDGFDFSGYSSFYNWVKFRDDSYVIFSNSSVNSIQSDFLDSYVKYLDKNQDVGILGISCNTKCFQSLVRNNFNPHLQSFFLLTTIGVMNEIVQSNGGKFPGEGITNKLLLIREGEMQISRIAMKLGYYLAVVLEDGSVFKFRRNNSYDNCYRRWVIQKGDMRTSTLNPSKINVIV